MSFLSIRTDISADRIQTAGQPQSEYIKAETWIENISGIPYKLLETVRFNDYLRQGGSSIRYYHLLDFNHRGLALAVSPEGPSRLISGLYENRQVVFSPPIKPIILLPNGLSDKLKNKLLDHPITNVSICSLNNSRLTYTVNCIEFFSDRHVVSGSLRLPWILIKGHPYAGELNALINKHCNANKSEFTPLHIETADVTLETCVQYQSIHPVVTCRMIVGSHSVISIEVASCRMY